jgi:hypothetical protein
MKYTIRQDDYISPFLFCLMAFGAAVGSVFPELSNKVKTSNFLLLPASTFEKALTQFLIYIVIGSLLFLTLFWLDAHVLRWLILQKEIYQTGRYSIEPFQFSSLLSTMDLQGILEQLFLVSIILTIGVFLFTARLFFQRYALVKSVIAAVGTFLLSTCCLVALSHLFFRKQTHGFAIEIPQYEIAGQNNVFVFVCVIFYVAWIFLLPLAYFKLKEKQV